MSLSPAFAIPAPPLIPINGAQAGYPVARIFCVGRNYVAHAAEMGNEVDRETPFYFTKSAQALCLSGAEIPYPPGSGDVHHEMELVVALGGPAFRVSEAAALDSVFGYACGIDLTRRDLQGKAKAKGRPWDLGKDFESSAIIAPITLASAFGRVQDQRIRLDRNGVTAQDARLSDMVWSVTEVIAHLSCFYHLGAGDLIYTGTPAGVGPVSPGDHLSGGIDGLDPLTFSIAAAD